MTRQTEQLTDDKKAAAYLWLTMLTERFSPLDENGQKAAGIVLRAWEEAAHASANHQALAAAAHQSREYYREIVESMCGTLVRIVNGQPELLFDFRAHLERQRIWSEHTFSPGTRAQGIIDHIRKELREIAENPGDLEEWIDVVILSLDGAWRTGATPDAIIETLTGKQTKNEHRDWPDWREMPEDQAIEHDRSDDGSVSLHQALIALGKRHAGYGPGDEGWTAEDQAALDESSGATYPVSRSPTSPVSDLEWLEELASANADGATREAIINVVGNIRRSLTADDEDDDPPTGPNEREVTGADVIDWADGIRGALGTEHAAKVTEQEARIADAIVCAMHRSDHQSAGAVPLREMALQGIQCWESLYENEKGRSRILCELLDECRGELAALAADTRRSVEIPGKGTIPDDHDFARVTKLEDLVTRCENVRSAYRTGAVTDNDALRQLAQYDEAEHVRRAVGRTTVPPLCPDCAGTGAHQSKRHYQDPRVDDPPMWLPCITCGGTGLSKGAHRNGLSGENA